MHLAAQAYIHTRRQKPHTQVRKYVYKPSYCFVAYIIRGIALLQFTYQLTSFCAQASKKLKSLLDHFVAGNSNFREL